jgi:hypothetical protein
MWKRQKYSPLLGLDLGYTCNFTVEKTYKDNNNKKKPFLRGQKFLVFKSII